MKPYKLAVIAGEESGDQLGADIVAALKERLGSRLKLIGVGGKHLENQGLDSLFPAEDIALIGLGGILKKLPLLLSHLYKTRRYLAKEAPDCLLIIDSPEFTHRVAKAVRKSSPSTLIVQYVAPSVWAWRPARAKKIANYIDHILAILPFEEKVIEELAGPKTSYVGHRLTHYPPLQAVGQARQGRRPNKEAPCLLFLPGSRRSEIRRHMPIFGEVAKLLKVWIPQLEILLPTLEKTHLLVEDLANNWEIKPKILTGESHKWQAFDKADLALAASGTVSLELAFARVPMILCYKVDWISKVFLQPFVKIWTAALPNIILDSPVILEYFNEYAKPAVLAHNLRYLLMSDHHYQAQMEAFDHLAKIMHREKAPNLLAAKKLLELMGF